jgi:lipopolysaccharide heptosyltransferase II
MRRDILRERYDLVLDIHDSLRSRLLCLGHHRVERIQKRKFRRFVLVTTKWNLYPDPPVGVAERYLETVRSLGVTNDGQGLDIHVPAHAQERAREVLRGAGVEEGERLIGICPAAKHANKMWFKDRFAEVASTLARERNATVVLFGSAEERPRCEEISAMIGQQAPGVRVANLAGRLSLLETAAAMDRCLVVVCNDSGLMHIAAARKRAVVAVFGPTVREFGFFPYSTSHAVVEYDGLSCRPCTHIGLSRCPKGHFKCMAGIPGDRVVAAARQLLGN